jgi:WD40 repeat protein
MLITLSMDGVLKMHNLITGKPDRKLNLGGTISCFSWNQNSDTMVYATYQASKLTMIDMEGRELWVKPSDNWMHDASWSPDGNQLMVVASYSPVQIYSKNGELLCSLRGIADPYGAEEAKWSPNSKYIAAMGNNGLLHFYDTQPIFPLNESPVSYLMITLIVILGLVNLLSKWITPGTSISQLRVKGWRI